MPPRGHRERPAVRPLAGPRVRHADRRHRHPGRAAATPYNLAVELARGKLNDLRNQLADWRQMGLRTPADLDATLRRGAVGVRQGGDLGRRPVGLLHTRPRRASPPPGRPATCSSRRTPARSSRPAWPARAKLPTQLVLAVEGDPRSSPLAGEWTQAFNAARVGSSWKTLAPSEGQFRWDEFDAQLAWAQKQNLAVHAGPLLDFRPGALPDWIWLWEGDFETVLGLVVDLVRQAVQRYKGKVPVWHLVHRPASVDFLGLSEEEQIRIAARADPGRPPDRPAGAVHRRGRTPLGRVDGEQPVPARPAPPGRLSGPRRPRPGGDRAGGRPRLLDAPAATSATSSTSRSCSTSTPC